VSRAHVLTVGLQPYLLPPTPYSFFREAGVRTEIMLVLLIVGCYTYRPLPSTPPETGSRVSAELTDQGSIEMTSQLGPGVTQVQGEVLPSDSIALRLAILTTANNRGIESDWQREQVAIPVNALGRLEQRKFSVSQTALAGGLAITGLYAMYRLLGGPGIFEGSAGHGSSEGS